MASELSISETDGLSFEDEEMKIGIETPPILCCSKKNGKNEPKSVRASLPKKLPRLDNSSALDSHDQIQKKEEPKE
jgi:hypothetical protein